MAVVQKVLRGDEIEPDDVVVIPRVRIIGVEPPNEDDYVRLALATGGHARVKAHAPVCIRRGEPDTEGEPE